MSAPFARVGSGVLYVGDCRDVVPRVVEPESVDAVVTDPPYELGFMGRRWDATGVALDVRTWEACFAALKPGGWLVAFGGTRTDHRMKCAIEDAGFEIRDSLPFFFGEGMAFRALWESLNDSQRKALATLVSSLAGDSYLAWLYGSGFPKSLDVSKAIDKAAGEQRTVVGYDPTLRHYDGSVRESGRKLGRITYAQDEYSRQMGRVAPITSPATDAAREWEGWGTALKPCHEPIVLARKPLRGTVAANVLEHGTGALNIDGCRIATSEDLNGGAYAKVGRRTESHSLRAGGGMNVPGKTADRGFEQPSGRWPGNVLLGCACEDEHDPDCAVRLLDEQSGTLVSGANPTRRGSDKFHNTYSAFPGQRECVPARGADSGGASRFFYTAKASRSERTMGGAVDNPHATVKPLDLMRWLVRLVARPGALVLDLFTGSGTTWLACEAEGMRFVGFELLEEHAEIISARVRASVGPLFAAAGGEG